MGILRWLGIAIVGLALLGGVFVALKCPCEQMPGIWLSGETVSDAVEDWTFANQAPLCQLQVKQVLPHAINLNCMSDGANLYVSCSRCETKYWSSVAVATKAGQLRVGKKLYPVTLARVSDPRELDHAWQVRARKLEKFGRGNDSPRPDHWWSFRLASAP